MSWSKSDQSSDRNPQAEVMSTVDTFTPDRAALYARKMYTSRYKGWGGEADALREVGRWCGMTPRSLKRLIKGETKDPGMTVFARIRAAYLSYLARQIAEIQHEIAVEITRCGDDHLGNLEAEAAALAAKIQAAKA